MNFLATSYGQGNMTKNIVGKATIKTWVESLYNIILLILVV